jgi:hypothetical protein
MGISTGINVPPRLPQVPKGSYAISGDRVVTPENLNRTFRWGEHGMIEMKPMEDVVRSTLAPGEKSQLPQEVVQEALATDPYKYLQQQQVNESKQLETIYAQAEENLTKESQYKLEALNREYQINLEDLQRQHLGKIPEGKTRQDQQEVFEQAVEKLNTKMRLAQLKIESAIKPELDVLALKKQEDVLASQEAFKKQSIRLQTVDALIEDGTIQDPDVAQQARLRAVDINLPIGAFRPQLTPQQELQRVSQDIGRLNKALESVGSIEDVQQIQGYITQLSGRMTELLRQVYGGRYDEELKGTNRLKKAMANTVIPATGRTPSTIGTAINKEKTKTQKTTGRVRMVSPDGVTGTVAANEVTKYQQQGYRRI